MAKRFDGMAAAYVPACVLALLALLAAVGYAQDTGHLKSVRLAEGNAVRTSSASVTTTITVVVSSTNARPGLVCFNNSANAVALGSPSNSAAQISNTGVIVLASGTINLGGFTGQISGVTLSGTAEMRCWQGLTE